MNKIGILFLLLLVTNLASYFACYFQSNTEIKSLSKVVKNKSDTLKLTHDSVSVLSFMNYHLKQSDSMGRALSAEKDKVVLELRNNNLFLKGKVAELEAWKLDAQDGIIIQLDTIKVRKKGIFGLGNGYKVIK